MELRLRADRPVMISVGKFIQRLFCRQVRHERFDSPLVFVVSIKRVPIHFSFGKAIAARLCEQSAR
jgi:hypothetical protein